MYSTMTVKYSKKDWVVEDSFCCNSAIKSVTFFFSIIFLDKDY